MSKLKKQSSPKVSVVMPVFNGACTIRHSIGSVLAQTYRDFELIICNDASTDETADILSNIADGRVRVLENSYNMGEGAARDRAIASAQGTWLAVLDADDTWAPERLEILMKQLVVSPDQMIFDDILQCHDTADGMVPWRVLRGKYAFEGDGSQLVQVPVEEFICQERLLIKPLLPVDHVRRHQISHTSRRFAADTEFFLRVLAHGLKLCYLPQPMYFYRITPGSMSSLTYRSTMMREVLENAVNQFDNSPKVRTALQKKINIVTRDEHYMPFIWELRKKRFRRAFQMACNKPWIISEFLQRLWPSIVYNIHRIKNGGRSRSIS